MLLSGLVAQAALERYIRARVGTDGAVRAKCRSRIFESALMLRLLRLEQVHPEVQARVVHYLEAERHKKEINPFDAVLIHGVLRETTAPDPGEVERYFATCEHFASRRKRMMFCAVLALMNGTRFDDEFQEADFVPKEQYQSWVRVEVIALKILYAVSLDHREWIKEEDVLVLTDALMQSLTLENMVLRQILTLFALRLIPRQESTVHWGIERLVALQNRDGGFSYLLSMEIFCTATAGLALAGCSSGASRATLLAMTDYLAAQQQADGGWAYGESVRQTDVDDTSYCLQFLRSLGPNRYAANCAQATAYLLAMPGSDGGFPTFARGAVPEIAMTAAAVVALFSETPFAPVPMDVLRGGMDYILKRQKADGTFERSWSLCETNAIFRAMAAIRLFRNLQDTMLAEQSEIGRRIDQAMARSREYLSRAQNEDGGWGQLAGASSDVISTSYALIALDYLKDSTLLKRGLSYLISQQQASGGFASIPDQAGPRPIPFDIPIIADIFALIALNHALAAHAESPSVQAIWRENS